MQFVELVDQIQIKLDSGLARQELRRLPLAERGQVILLTCLVQLVELARDFVPANKADPEGLLLLDLVKHITLLVQDVIVL